MTFGTYLRAAFVNPWNLLLLLGGLGLAALSPWPLAAVPAVVGIETCYLLLAASSKGFRARFHVQQKHMQSQEGTVSPELKLRQLMSALPAASIERFQGLRSRCREFRQIAQQVRTGDDGAAATEELELENLDKLLWIHVRLLFTEQALKRFLMMTPESELQRDLLEIEGKLKEISAGANESGRAHRERILEDNRTTARERLQNFQKAKDNLELVHLEIERLEDKIRALAELAVNRQPAGSLSEQINQTVTSMVQTEQLMNDLRPITGLPAEEEVVPEFLRRELIQGRHS